MIVKPEQVMALDGLMLDAQQLDFKGQFGIGWDDAGNTTGAISRSSRTGEPGFATHLHFLHALGPARDDSPQRERSGLVAFIRAIELGSVRQCSTVMHADRVVCSWRSTLTWLDMSHPYTRR